MSEALRHKQNLRLERRRMDARWAFSSEVATLPAEVVCVVIETKDLLRALFFVFGKDRTSLEPQNIRMETEGITSIVHSVHDLYVGECKTCKPIPDMPADGKRASVILQLLRERLVEMRLLRLEVLDSMAQTLRKNTLFQGETEALLSEYEAELREYLEQIAPGAYAMVEGGACSFLAD